MNKDSVFTIKLFRCESGFLIHKKSEQLALTHISLHNHHVNASFLKVKFGKEYGINLIAYTVQRCFADCGLDVYHLNKKPLLTKKKMQKRLSWA